MRKKMVDPIYRLTRSVEHLESLAASRPDLGHIADELQKAKTRLSQVLAVTNSRMTRVA